MIRRAVLMTLAWAVFALVPWSGGMGETPPTQYPDNEEGAVQDMLTPAYYQVPEGAAFREEVNRFVYFARGLPFQHPLADSFGATPSFFVSDLGRFGAPKGPNQDAQHHPAIDIYVAGRTTDVGLYAAHAGTVRTLRDADKYRHLIAITKEIVDEAGQLLGHVVTLYGHVDLDQDEADGLFLDGRTVERGDLVSRHLYAGTMGGPHLHLEIRYYRADDTGTETFYGGRTGPGGSGELTDPSSGIWTYGYWNSSVGYGFADPRNHGIE